MTEACGHTHGCSHGVKARSYLASIIRNAAASSSRLVENTIRANEEIQRVRDVMNSEWYFALSEFDEDLEGISSAGVASDEEVSALVSRLQAAWVASMTTAFLRSFRLGYGSRGRQDSSSITLERAYEEFPMLKDIIDKHSSFAAQFARQYSQGYTDRRGAMGFPARITMYGSALKAGYNAGAIHGGRSGERIFWRLGACDHCVDCPALSAASPFTSATIPTLPGNGDTICRTNCCCYLVFVNGPRELEPDDAVDSWIGESISLVESEDDKMNKLYDLSLKRAFLKRQVSEDGVLTASREEIRSLGSQIDSMSTTDELKRMTRYNPSSVITRADISLQDVSRILDMGIDGPSIFRADMSGALSLVDSIIAGLGGSKIKKISAPAEDEEREPQVKSSSIINLVGDGTAETYTILRHVLSILSENEMFLTIAPLDEKSDRVLGFSGIWLSGSTEDLDRVVSILSGAGVEFGKAEMVKV
jgi:hypothetical protein